VVFTCRAGALARRAQTAGASPIACIARLKPTLDRDDPDDPFRCPPPPVRSRRRYERFAFCSTFKVILASAVLANSARSPGLLERTLHYTQSELVAYSPVSSQHVATGMTVAALCEAALQHSDNSAANLLIKLVGGPAAVTAYARSVGDTTFRLDRWETSLNTATPGDPRD
jgi:beta-lactamase class A